MANATAETDRSEGLKALESAVGLLRKKYGTGTVMRADEGIIGDVEVIPTGILPLDVALGVGGLPVGRIVEIFGPESSGKTTLCYEIMANAQRAGGMCAFIDTEHAMDKLYAEAVGVKTDELYVSQPDNGEQAIDVAETLLCSGALSVIVIDSVAALVPKAELEGEMGDSLPGVQARLMSKACRRLSILANQHNTMIIFTNQLREKIGVMFGSPEVTTGGRALKFYASVRLDIRRIETIKDGTDSVANRTRVKTVKNKVAPPFQQAEFEIIFGEGADRVGSMIDLGVEVGKIEKAGAFFTLPNGDKVQGRAKTREYLKEHPEVAAEIEAAIRAIKLPEKVELPPFELGEVTADDVPEVVSAAETPALAEA